MTEEQTHCVAWEPSAVGPVTDMEDLTGLQTRVNNSLVSMRLDRHPLYTQPNRVESNPALETDPTCARVWCQCKGGRREGGRSAHRARPPTHVEETCDAMGMIAARVDVATLITKGRQGGQEKGEHHGGGPTSPRRTRTRPNMLQYRGDGEMQFLIKRAQQ